MCLTLNRICAQTVTQWVWFITVLTWRLAVAFSNKILRTDNLLGLIRKLNNVSQSAITERGPFYCTVPTATQKQEIQNNY